MSQNVTSRSLSANQQRALAALLSTPTIAEAATKCGLTRKTIHAYLRDEDFAQAYREERERLVEQTVAGLQRIGTEAVEVLHDAFEDPDVNARIRAARYVLDLTFKVHEVAELRREIEEIKAFDREHFGTNGGRFR